MDEVGPPGNQSLPRHAARLPLALAEEAQFDTDARLLLERFWRDGDSAVFTQLFELAHERLLRSARSITRRIAPQLEPEDLVANFMARLFTDLRRRTEFATQQSETASVRSLLALAHTSMRNDALDQLRMLRRAAANARVFQATCDEPIDPSCEVLATEVEERLACLDAEVLRLCQESFAALEPRDQQVLVARELVGLSYERVAALLQRSPGQVGMVIRRARLHLLQGLGQRLPRLRSPDREEQLLLNSLQSGLDLEQGPRHVPALLQRMLERSAAAARRTLADLIYEMAKACLVEAPGFSERMLIQREPRDGREVGLDLQRLASRLSGQREAGSGATDGLGLGSIASTRPAPATALDDARACLDKLHEVEGPSGRQQVALALCYIHAGQPAVAEPLLRALLERPLPVITRQNAARNLTLSLLRQERHAEALDFAEAGADEWPDDPVRVMNVAYAAARLGERERFVRAAARLAALHAAEPSPRVRAWLRDDLPRLARECRLEMALPSSSDPQPELQKPDQQKVAS
ncbi:MAG: sigma-70 family RNA polymerase sigma factor [Planctomycetota bacterium]